MPDAAGPQWLVEEGIGEQRAILFDGETVKAARLAWSGELRAGYRFTGKLIRKTGTRGIAQTADGREVLVDRLPKDASEGASCTFTVTRSAMAESGRFKLPAARLSGNGDEPPDPLIEARVVRRFPAGSWEEIWHAAAAGRIEFSGGSLVFAITPAMTLIDIDGDLPPRELALAAVPHIARWLRLFDLGGSIGIDFPTIAARADRKAVDAALSDAMEAWPHERTAINGFGFVQIVARLEGPSLLHRFAMSRTETVARMALRQAEMVDGAGITLLTVHPAVKARLKSDWIAEVERRTGRPLRVEADPGLALDATAAQIIST